MLQLKTSKVTTEMQNKISFLYCKHAVHLVMCKSYQGLDADPARGGVGSSGVARVLGWGEKGRVPEAEVFL